jgi:hypothetical protein
MTLQPITHLREDLASIRKILLESRLLPFAPEAQQSYLADAQHLEGRLEQLTQSHLVMGLLGGTGVGKSTLMNALAGSPIASTDHRRPHTDRVLIYHYTKHAIPAAVTRSRVPWQAIPHDAEEIRHLVLCDLPDFDSLVAANREMVLDFLEHLDVLVWVSSPEKYGDARFYEFLGLVPKAKEHFVFVLNKTDLLFAAKDGLERQEMVHHAEVPDTPSVAVDGIASGGLPTSEGAGNAASGYGSLEKLIARFQEHIRRHGISHPLIFAVSAHQVVAGQTLSSWNQFAAFRHYVFQQRDIKEIMAIKAANLDEEIRRLVDTVRSELATHARAAQVLQQLSEVFSQETNEWIASGRLALDQWLEQNVAGVLDQVGSTPSWLVGPGRLLASMGSEWRQWRRTGYGSERSPAGAFGVGAVLPDGLKDRLHGRLQHIEHRLANELMRQGLPAVLTDRLLQAMDLEAAWEQFTLKVHNSVESRLLLPTEPSRTLGFAAFRSRQVLAYGVLLTLFLVVAGGDRNWMSLCQHPSWSNLAGVVLAVFSSLFSPSGLAALVTLGVLSLLLAARFLRSYKKLLQRHHRTIIDALKNEVGNHWDGVLCRVIATLDERRLELDQPVKALTQVRRETLGE